MGLDEKALGTAAATIAYGMTGVLSLIPALQEISLDRKLNEDKTRLEKNGFHPDLVARHIHNNGAVFIGCGQDTLEPIRQELTRGGVPFISINSSMIEDEGKRPPYFYTVVVRDIDGERAADLLKDLLKDLDKSAQQQEQEEELEEEEDLEREIGEQEETVEEPDRESQDGQTEEEDAQDSLDEEEEPGGEDEDVAEEKAKEKKKAAAKRKAERRRERRRAEEAKRQEAQKHEDSVRCEEESRHTADSGHREQERREEEHRTHQERDREQEREQQRDRDAHAAAAATGAASAVASMTSTGEPSWTDYRDAYAIRAAEIEAQCERYAKAELMRREIERMKLSGKDTGEEYSRLKEQYRNTNDEIQAHHDRFQSVGKGGWQEYAAEAAERARNASTEELREHTWEKPDGADYLRRNQDGSYSTYTREEKKTYLEGKYKNGEANVALHGYAQDTVRHEELRRQEELVSARARTDTQDGMSYYKSLLDKYNVTDQEVSKYKSWETVKREVYASERKLEETEKRLESQGFTGVREYRERLEDSIKDTESKRLSWHTVAGEHKAPDPSASVKGPDGAPVVDFRERKFSRSAYEALPVQKEVHEAGKTNVSFTRVAPEDATLKQIANGNTILAYMEKQGSTAYGAVIPSQQMPYVPVRHAARADMWAGKGIGTSPGTAATTPGAPGGAAPMGGGAGGFKGQAMRAVPHGQTPASGGILISAGVCAVNAGAYRRKGSSGQESFQGIANGQPVAAAGTQPYASSAFTGSTERTRAASAMAANIGVLPMKGNIKAEGEQSVYMGKAGEIRQDSLRRIESINARTAHAAMDMMKNRYFAMVVKQGARTAVQSVTGDTEAGRMAMSAMYAVKLPAHMVKQQMLNMGRTSLDQGDTVMTALNSHIIRSRAASACAMDGEALEKFARKSGLDVKMLKAAQNDPAAMERLVAMRYAGTFRTPGKNDMRGLIQAMGIRRDLLEQDNVSTEDILGFLSRHKQSTMAERDRALKSLEGGLDGLSVSQKRLVESLFSQEKFFDKEDMQAILEKNGVAADLVDKLAGKNWAADGDILAALRQAGISEDKAGALMKQLKGVSMEDRSAMMGLFHLYAGDSLDGFDMDKFRKLLNVLDVDQSLKDELGRNFIHLSHMSMEDIKKLLVKYKGNAEAEAFLNRLLNEKVCLILGRNREMSRFELMNGMENMMFRMAQRTDAMMGFNQVMGLGRGLARVTKGGYRLLYNMAFRRMTSPIGIGKLKVTPADLTAANIKAAAVETVKQTKVAATFSKMLNRRVPQGLKRVAGHALHPGRFIGQAVARKVEWILAKHGVDTLAIKAGVKMIAGKATAAAAAASEVLLAVCAVVLVVIILLMAYESIDLGGDGNGANNYSAAYVSAADGKDAFVQEAVDMLRGYTDDFITEINDAQYNRGMYAGMNGYNTNENVGAFEAGAYQVVFRGADGQPIDDITSVDLNNSKDIISMASVFIPTVFTKPSENASQQAKTEYEKDKEHFLDYCTFLWAASHQISIEEYHPGNASNPDANDESGLQTDAQTGKCGMDYTLNGDQGAGVNWWIGTGASPTTGELCGVCQKTDWYETDIAEHACVVKPAADPCTHGHWQTVSTPLKHKACSGHHHHCSKHDYWYSCADKGKTRWDKEGNTYKRVWVCDGHMGAVVYATIGRISRMPNFGTAADYDFDNPETYGGGGGIYSYFGGSGGEGSTAFQGASYSLTDAQLRYLAAMCMGEQRVCATNEVTMRYQASLMVNVYELYGKKKGLSLYQYLTLLPKQGGWFATTSHTYADKNAGSVSAQALEWIKDVICNGNRITKANEQGTLVTGFVKAVYNGKEYTGNAMKNESIYVPGETILYTSGGQACLFEAFPGGHPAGCGTPVVDPFAIIIN